MTNTALMQAGLNLIGQALSIYDSDLRLAACNTRFGEMFTLPATLTTPGARFEDTIRHLVSQGEYGPVDEPESFIRDRVETARAFAPHYMERTRANGRTISVEGAPLPRNSAAPTAGLPPRSARWRKPSGNYARWRPAPAPPPR